VKIRNSNYLLINKYNLHIISDIKGIGDWGLGVWGGGGGGEPPNPHPPPPKPPPPTPQNKV